MGRLHSVPPTLRVMNALIECLPPAASRCIYTSVGVGTGGIKKKGVKKVDARRAGVSAETGNMTSGEVTMAVYDKSPEARARIMKVTENNTLFAGITERQREEVVDAMFEVGSSPGQVMIAQGDLGDNFYVVESGEYAVLLKQKGETPVAFYHSGDSFGELALMYTGQPVDNPPCRLAKGVCPQVFLLASPQVQHTSRRDGEVRGSRYSVGSRARALSAHPHVSYSFGDAVGFWLPQVRLAALTANRRTARRGWVGAHRVAVHRR